MKDYESFDDFACDMAQKIDSDFAENLSEENEEEILQSICQNFGFPEPIDFDF